MPETMTASPTAPAAAGRYHWLSRIGGVVVVLLAGLLDLGTTGIMFGPLKTLSGETVPTWQIAGVVVLMVTLLFFRHRYAVPVLLVVAGISAAITLWLATSQPLFCTLVAVHAAARRGSVARSILALTVGLLSLPLVVVAVMRAMPEADVWDWAFPALLFGLFVLVAWGTGTRDRFAHQRAMALRGTIDVTAEQATQAERRRIARELHDIVAHSVSAMMMQAAGARAMASSVQRDQPDDPRLESVVRALGTIETTGAQSMRELHRLLGVLREDVTTRDAGAGGDLDRDLSPSAQPSLQDIEALVEVPRSSGLIVEVHRSGSEREVDPSVGAAAYRVVQESLTNALKHAGRGALVDVYLAWQGSDLQVQVRSRASHGMRPATPSSGVGLRGLRERVGLVGGSFEAGWAGEEFVSTAVLPVRPPASGQGGAGGAAGGAADRAAGAE